MEAHTATNFKRNYERHLQHLKLKGLQPKTIDAYARAIRQAGERFNHQIDELSAQQLTDYFSERLASHSWSAVKLDLYGLRFYYEHVLAKPWPAPGLVKPPRSQRLPDIVTVDEMQRVISATQVLSYRVFFFTLYSLGLRLGEGLRLEVGDIDGARGRVHIRNSKGNKDRARACSRYPCRRPRTGCCATTGKSTAIPCCCFLAGWAEPKAGPAPRRRSTAKVWRLRCTRSLPVVG